MCTVNPSSLTNDNLESKTALTEGERIISNDVEVAETMNEIFITVTDSLAINENSNDESSTNRITDNVDNAGKNFRIILAF